jgi:hypothetical protein
MKIDGLPNEVKATLHMLVGALNLPELKKFESAEHFLHEVLNRIQQAKGLTRQALKNLGDEP